MFLDLGVAWDPVRAPAMVELALRFGYTGIAFNVTVSGSQVLQLASHRCPIRLCPLPVALERCGPLRGALAAELGVEAEDPRQAAFLQLRRLTVVVADAAQVAAAAAQLRRTQPPAYHVVAIRPTSEEAFQHTCERGECSIISISLDEKVPFMLRRKDVDAFLRRGGCFEVEFAPALRDPGRRRVLIANVDQLLHATQGKGLLLSSGAREPLEMRSPHDLGNFGAVLGLRGGAAAAGRSLGDVPYRALQHALLRRGGVAQASLGPAPAARAGGAAQVSAGQAAPAAAVGAPSAGPPDVEMAESEAVEKAMERKPAPGPSTIGNADEAHV